MDSGSTLMLMLTFSAIGMGFFSYGRKQDHTVALLCGIVLMVYPYFVTELLPLVVVGVVVMAIPFLVRR